MKFNRERLREIAWKPVKKYLPPDNDELLEVMDKDYNKGYAIPCWHNFKIVNNEVVKTEPQFDGWMIQADGLEVPKLGEIKWWRKKGEN